MVPTHIWIPIAIGAMGCLYVYFTTRPEPRPVIAKPTKDPDQEGCTKDLRRLAFDIREHLARAKSRAEITALQQEITWLEETFRDLVPREALDQTIQRLDDHLETRENYLRRFYPNY